MAGNCLDSPPGLWSTQINVMRIFSANAIISTGFAHANRIAGAISIPAIRISGHIARAGIGA
jgi:hypothetical protein